MREAIVLGAGVNGLCAAIRLQETGWQVRIWARELGPRTTSHVAAAIWYPYRAEPVEKVREWGTRTCEALCELAKDPATGVFLAQGTKIFHRPMGDPWWRDVVPAFRRLRPEELPAGTRAGYAFTVPVADMSVYLVRYLVDRFTGAGGAIVERAATLDEALAASPLVVNCTGLGAREVANDPQVFPIRGQVLRTTLPPSRAFLIDTDHPSGLIYIIPRLHDCVLGGTSQDGEWSLEPDAGESAAIQARCASLVPGVKDVTVLGAAVGLRPGRASVRLEAERRGHGIVIHNYGHGGAGVTLSWGCADEIASLAARELLSDVP